LTLVFNGHNLIHRGRSGSVISDAWKKPSLWRTAAAERVPETARGQMISVSAAGLDCAFLTIVVAASLMLYVRHLGFYYDDYSVLERMRVSHDGSLLGLYHAVRPATGQRPLQALTFATLYWIFGDEPLGYHVSNACLLIVVASLLYLILRELRLPRLLCVAVPLVYSTLPHYATNRFWLDAFQITLSGAFFLTSLYAGLRCLRASWPGLGMWLLLAVVGVGASLLAYEVVYPLFILSLCLIWWAARRLPRAELNPRAVPITLAALGAAILVFGLAKAALVAEHGQNGYQVGFQEGFLHHFLYLVSGSVKLNLGSYFLAFPYVLWWIVRHHLSAADAAVAAITGLVALLYLGHIGRRERDRFAASGVWKGAVVVGVLALVLGYAIFVTNANVLFRSAGIDNRVNAGAALGVAGVFVGTVGWLVGRLEPRWRVIAFSATVASAVAAGVLVIDSLGSFWTSAARQQQAIVSGLARATGPHRGWDAVILDGSCPETGPAVVFADQWDLRGALQTHYHDHALVADVAAEAMHATPSGLALEMTFLEQVSTRTYPYGPGLAVYDASNQRLYPLLDRRQAERYLARSRPAFRCAPQRSFAWGFDPRRWSLL
jgi:hypothetical protein